MDEIIEINPYQGFKYLFCLDYVVFDFDVPSELIEGYFLQRITDEKLQEGLIKIVRGYTNNHASDNHNFILNITDDENGFSIDQSKIEKTEDRNYWVIEMPDDNLYASHIMKAFWLHSKPLRFDLKIGLDNNGNIKSRGQYHTSVENYYYDLGKFHRTKKRLENEQYKFNEEEFNEIKWTLNQIIATANHENIQNAIQEYLYLKNLPSSKIRLLLYFSIWEMLLAHNPDPKDPSDSITKQLVNKIKLINNRLTKKIDYNKYIDQNSAPDTIIKKLYTVRSRIAHGTPVEYRGDLAILKDENNTEDLLNEITKKLLIGGLTEPELFRDLKDC